MLQELQVLSDETTRDTPREWPIAITDNGEVEPMGVS